MKNKSMIYVMLAVTIGYFLISSIPGKFAMLVEQKMMISERQMLETPKNFTEEDTNIFGENNKSTSDSEELLGDNEPLAAKEAGSAYNERSNIFTLSIWWTIDLMIAVAVYWVAKNRFF